MFYSLLAVGCDSFMDLESFSGQIKLVLNFGKLESSEIEHKFLIFIISSTEKLKFTENVGLALSSKPSSTIDILDPSLAGLKVSFVHSKLQADQVLLPSCLVCLSRLDKNVTGLSPLSCRDLYHFCCQEQCKKLSGKCGVCASVSSQQRLACQDCGSEDDLWICLLCGNVGCGRYRGGHAHCHFELTRHVFALNSDSHHIWDYLDDRYVHRTIRCAQGIVAIEDVAEVEAEDSSFSAELSTAQLESQKAFFDERQRQQEAHFNRILAVKEAEYAEEVQKLRSELEHLQRERAIFSELKTQLQTHLQRQKLQSDKFAKDFEAEKLISEGLLKRNDELQQKIQNISAERDDLSDQIVDLMKHFETLELVAQAGNNPDIVNGKIVIKSPAKKSSKKKL